ncbi:MAG: acetolactate decarboxylase [Chloroflexota bacterium]
MTRRDMLMLVVVTIIVTLVLSFALYELTYPEQDTLFQVSAFNVFSAGNFEGNMTYAELAKYGDFGIGTLNDLNGEMFALNGKFYQIPATGAPREIGSSEKAPYATVTFFNSDQKFSVVNVSSYLQLTEDINLTLTNYNAIYAIKVHGFFNFVKTRSVPAQSKPYPTLTDAVKNQTVFTLQNVEGTMVGFYFPNSMQGVDSIGYHLHFLADDHTAGGHLLECTIKDAIVEIDQMNNYHLLIP